MRRAALISSLLFAVAVAAGFLVTTGFAGYGHPAYLVRAIFDDASFAVQGEDVRVAGANVGTIQSLSVTADKQAAVTLAISRSAVRALLFQCELRDPPAIADRRGVR